MVQPGMYKHFKGGLYRVLFAAIDASNDAGANSKSVVYVSLATGGIFTRTEDEFEDWVLDPTDGNSLVPRFLYIGI